MFAGDLESAILVSMRRFGRAVTVTELADYVGASKTAVRDRLHVMRDHREAWVIAKGNPARWVLSMWGRDIARNRRWERPE